MSSKTTYDVIVVGGGLSGLQAALTAHEAGLSVLVLEANDHMGGKVLSSPCTPGSKHTVDMGPAWINDTNQSRIWELGQKVGAKFQVQREEGDEIFESETGEIKRQPRGNLEGTPEEQLQVLQLALDIDEIGNQLKEEDFHGPISWELDQLTFKDWVVRQTQNLKPAINLCNFLTRVINGAEADEISALYMLKYIEAASGFMNIVGTGKNCGQYLRPMEGSQVFVSALTAPLPPSSLLTSSPVSHITQHANHINIQTTTSKIYTARKAILSIPTPLYQHIKFTPPLPSNKQTLTTSTHMGYYTKFVASYNTPWWRSAHLSGETQSHSSTGPIIMTMDTCVPSQRQFSLSLFMVGAPGRAWSLLSPEEQERTALAHLDRLYAPFMPDGKIPDSIHTIVHDWSKEAYIEGAPSTLCKKGVLTGEGGGEVMRERVGGLHFVGTEMSEVWEGYMEGAVRDGERGALEVVEALKMGDRMGGAEGMAKL